MNELPYLPWISTFTAIRKLEARTYFRLLCRNAVMGLSSASESNILPFTHTFCYVDMDMSKRRVVRNESLT
jgi:hypothetical protein